MSSVKLAARVEALLQRPVRIASCLLVTYLFFSGIHTYRILQKSTHLLDNNGALLGQRQLTVEENVTTKAVQSTTEYLDLLDEDIFIPTYNEQILVVYSGPTSMDAQEGSKNELYLRNFDFFLKHGVDCTNHDTVIVVTDTVAKTYRPQITALDDECKTHDHSVTMLIREPVCYDMESVRIVFEQVDVMPYDYFVYVNCGMSGPAPKTNSSNDVAWTHKLISRLDDKVKMVGLSIKCFLCNPHVQSFTFALDRAGLQILKDSNAIFNCRESRHYTRSPYNAMRNEIIQRYEIGMSKAILDAGYGISSILWTTTVFDHNKTSCQVDDYWTEEDLQETYCQMPSLEDTLFFKTSRLLPQEIADELHYTSEPSWTSRRPLLRLLARQVWLGFPFRRRECIKGYI